MGMRARTTGLAGTSAIVLVLALSSAVAAATLLTGATGPTAMETEDPVVAPTVDTTQTWEDVDGNGIDDDCQTTAAVEDPDAAAAADTAADLNGDGTLSVSEAAQTPRTGGKNCNHGGYVSQIAHAKHDCTTETPETETPDADAPDGDGTDGTTPVVTQVKASEDEQGDEDQDEDADAPDADQGDEDADDSDAEDGDAPKTCEELAADQAAHDAKKAEQQAAKDARKAAHDAAKAEREAAREAKKAEREAAKALHKASHGKSGAHSNKHGH
jgi:hypothetical protein